MNVPVDTLFYDGTHHLHHQYQFHLNKPESIDNIKKVLLFLSHILLVVFKPEEKPQIENPSNELPVKSFKLIINSSNLLLKQHLRPSN